MAYACQCPPWLHGAGTPLQVLEAFEDLVGSGDWRLREYLARQFSPGEPPEEQPDALEWKGRWATLRETLASDPNIDVRMALVESDLSARGPQWQDYHAQRMADFQALDRASRAPADIATRAVMLRKWAAHNYPDAALALSEDPICTIRADAVRALREQPQARARAETARSDPCPLVRAAAVDALGPPAGPIPTQLTAAEEQAWARSATDPNQLRELARRPDPSTRAVVVANPHCPADILLDLYQNDPDWDIWTTAKANPSWPTGMWPGDPLAERGIAQMRDPVTLRNAILGTRAHVRCASATSVPLATPGSTLPNAPRPCEEDALVLRSSGPVCSDHLAQLPDATWDEEADGYLAQRLRSGLWVNAPWGGPLEPVAELWRGSPW